MTRTFAPGSEEGFVLLDALLCLFATALLLLLLSCAVSGALQSSFRALNAGAAIIEQRNSNTALFFGRTEHDKR